MDAERTLSAADLDLNLPLSPVVLPSQPAVAQEAPDCSPATLDGGAPPADTSSHAGSVPVLETTTSAGPPHEAQEVGQAQEQGQPLRRVQRGDSHISRQSSLFLQHVRQSEVLVYGFGRGDCGQLGRGVEEDVGAPGPIELLQGKNVVGLSASYFHSAAVSGDGELYMFGSNDAAQLGLRNTEQAVAPLRLDALENFKVASVACGSSHTVAALDDGGVASWGASEFGQCGLETSALQVNHPRLLKSLKEVHVARVAAGSNHTLLLASTGFVYSCGDGTFGALGLGDTETCRVPRPILPLWPLGVVQVSCGENHSAALTADGQVFTWGRGKYGQLGLGDFDNRSSPVRMRALAGVPGQQLSCGGDHTALITRAGRLYTWGRGTWGQTGLGHCDNVSYPKLVEALEGKQLLQVSAGGRHTLVLGSNNELLGFGCNETGQLATGTGEGKVITPRKVQGLPSLPILYVAAGGDHSLVVLQRAQPGELVAIGPSHSRPYGLSSLPVPVPSLRQLLADATAAAGTAEAARTVGELCHGVEVVFSCPAFLTSTLLSGQEPWLVGSAQPQPMDTDDTANTSSNQLTSPAATAMPAAAADSSQPVEVTETYQGLLRLYNTDVIRTLGAACLRLLDTLEKYLTSLQRPSEEAQRTQQGQHSGAAPAPDLGWVARVLFILLQNPLNGDGGGTGEQLMMRVCRTLAGTLQGRQRMAVKQALQQQLQKLPSEVFGARCVRPVQRYIDGLVHRGKLGAARLQVLMAGVVLDVLRQANEEAGGIIAYQEFYNQALSEHANLREEYVLWQQHRESSPGALVSLCQMPYLLNPVAKSRILRGEAVAQQQSNMANAAMQAFFQGAGNPALAGYLAIQVRRTHVVEDALTQIMYRQQDLKKPLRVTFISGGLPEPAQDEGGVTKEFFQLLTRDLFRPEFGMFTYNELTRTFWFNPASLESEVEYALVGAVLGLAIYNGVLLEVHFPIVVYKKLLGEEPTFKDLKEAFPDLGRGLQQLLDFEGDVEATVCRSFAVEYEFWGEMRTQELMPGGSDIPVTAENRSEYVRLYTKWLLDTSIAAQFKAFERGFTKVCGGPALSLFRGEELELLVCGLPHLDFEELEKAASYEGGYTKSSDAVRWFWEILRAMPLEQKRQFLFFTTGSDRSPVGGLGTLKLLVQRSGPDTDRLPTAHTCFNALLLPDYSSKQKMAERLLTAVQNAQGFGLQ